QCFLENMGIHGVVLGEVFAEPLGTLSLEQIFVVEAQRVSPVSNGLLWVSASDVSVADCIRPVHGLAFVGWQRQTQIGRGPYCQRGWLDEVREWVRGAVEKTGGSLTGEFSQLRTSFRQTMVRFSASPSDVYFKGNPLPLAYEGSLTQWLWANELTSVP